MWDCGAGLGVWVRGRPASKCILCAFVKLLDMQFDAFPNLKCLKADYNPKKPRLDLTRPICQSSLHFCFQSKEWVKLEPMPANPVILQHSV